MIAVLIMTHRHFEISQRLAHDKLLAEGDDIMFTFLFPLSPTMMIIAKCHIYYVWQLSWVSIFIE